MWNKKWESYSNILIVTVEVSFQPRDDAQGTVKCRHPRVQSKKEPYACYFMCYQLKIETGKYQGTLLQDRKCERYSSGEVEDEYHFLFHCNKLENDRNLLLKEIAKRCPNFKRLNNFLEQTDIFLCQS
jgi:hypothetical protein